MQVNFIKCAVLLQAGPQPGLNCLGKLEYVGDVDDALADQVEAAADVCPMQAIEISA